MKLSYFGLVTTGILICNIFSSCFHKDVMNDAADDVSQTFVYEGKNGTYIITHELIFQATSKSSGGGFTSISGYNEGRLTSYDLETGALLGRVELGEEIEESCQIIGILNDQVWCYSINSELGLHCRDPKTLEVVKKESDLTVLAKYDFARPEWSNILDYYGYEVKNGLLVLTDMQGVLSYYDPAKNTVTETENSMPDVEWSPDYLSSNAYFDEDEYISFFGDGDRKKLQWKYEDSTADLPFLKPELFIDLNTESLHKREQARIDKVTAHRDSLKSSLDALLMAHPVFKNEYASWSDMTNDERELRNVYYDIKRDLEEAERDLEDLTDDFEDSNDYALQDKPHSCLVYSARSISDTAGATISCIDEVKPKKFAERWHLDLTSFYYDPDKAEGAGVFEEGDPEFRYRWAEIHKGKFVMIAQLQMICIDMATGKQLWKITL